MPDVSLELIQQMLQRVLDSQRETREDVRAIKSHLGRLAGDVAKHPCGDRTVDASTPAPNA